MEPSRGNPLHESLEEITGPTTGDALAEALARMGVAVAAQRVELFAAEDDAMALLGWWTALGYEATVDLDTGSVPISWFPWSLGNIRPSSHVLVRNAGPLLLRPDSDLVVADLGMGSALHLPVHDGFKVLGAACIYWAAERDDWASDRYDQVVELARNALL